MAVCRVEKTKNYTVMSNYHLSDPRLSLKAIGLLSKILSLPEAWDYTVAGLAKICKEGRDAVRAALAELEEAGYILRRQTHDEAGAFSSNEYVIYEFPQKVTAEECAAASPTQEPPVSGEESAPLPDFPSTENTLTETALTQNPAELNTKRIKYLSNNPPIVPPEGDGCAPKRKRAGKKSPDWKPERFEAFWSSYPRGEDKQAAIREWDKLKPDDALLREMALGLARDLQSEAWQRGIGIPYACRWLSHRRWEDEARKPAMEPVDEEPKGSYRL